MEADDFASTTSCKPFPSPWARIPSSTSGRLGRGYSDPRHRAHPGHRVLPAHRHAHSLQAPQPAAVRQAAIDDSFGASIKTIHDRILYGDYMSPDSGVITVGVGSTTSRRVSRRPYPGLAQRYGTIGTNPWYNVTTNSGRAPTPVLDVGDRLGRTRSSSSTRTAGRIREGHGHGRTLVYDSTPKPYQAYVVHFLIQFGLCVADPRKVQRLCNINTTAYWTPTAQLKALGQLPDGLDGAVLYVPRFVYTYMQVDALLGTNKLYTKEEVWGHQQQTFQGVPIKMVERIATNEGVVV